jgi:tetratricopeptide (TPR) repeat protein
MTGKVIPFPARFRLAAQGYHEHPAKVIEMRPRSIGPFARSDQEAKAYELYVNASAIDEDPASYDEAGAMYLEALTLDPELAIAHTNLGNIFWRQGKTDAALHRYGQAIEIAPYQPEALYNLGYVMLETGQPAKAVVWLQQAIRAAPNFADAWYNLAVAYEALGELSLMRGPLEHYCTLEPTGEWTDLARKKLGFGPPKPGTRRPRKKKG